MGAAALSSADATGGKANDARRGRRDHRGSTLCADTADGEDEDDEDEFLTPASTPPSTPPAKLAVFDDGVGGCHPPPAMEAFDGDDLGQNCEALLYEKMYDKFTVEFNHMQIIVAKVSSF